MTLTETTTTNMASHSGGFQPLCMNQEMDCDQGQPQILCEFLKSAALPMCVCVVSGKHITTSVQITKGDVIFFKSCEAKTVTLTHQDFSTGTRKQVNVPLDFPYKFNVLPPKTVSDRTASMIMYPSISDLIMDSPTYFEATSSYDDPYLPGFSIHRGDRFKFKGLVTDPKDGRERLKVRDELDNILLLSLNCRANFYPLEDDESYTLRELIDFAPVPRRLRLSKRDSSVSVSGSEDSGFKDGISTNEIDKPLLEKLGVLEKDVLQLINCDGTIHLLKPYLTVNASPLNDADTLWKIPITADLFVREHDLDDYEVPSIAKNQIALVPTPPPSPHTPTFPAPPTPPLPQPLIQVNAFNFIDIYGCPVKAKIMDLSLCDAFLKNLLNVSEDISIYRMEKTKRLYAEDLKTKKVYSFAKSLKVSFIEYPEKFSEVCELLKLPVGSEVTVLEDIASDFPRPFSLQFGDLLRITTNTAAVMKVKHTNIECKILKCEKVNRDGGSNMKMKLPLDFEMQMVLSIDPTSRKVISIDDLIIGSEPIPSQEVATLIDSSEKSLQDLPVNLRLLKILPERMILCSPYQKKSSSLESGSIPQDWPSPTHHSGPNRNIGISMTSGLLLAFRERLDLYEINTLQAQADVLQVPVEILTQSQFEERERICKAWLDEEEDQIEVKSVASDDRSERSSTVDLSSSHGSGNSSRKKQKRMDKIRRLSQVLNPKHWRPPKAVPEPLPHPHAIGLMALAMRPPSDQFNEYQIKVQEPQNSNSSVSSDEDVYEDVEIGPVRTNIGTPPPTKSETKSFFGPHHKSMPLKQIISRTNVKHKAKKGEKMKPLVSSPIHEGSVNSLNDLEHGNDIDVDPTYDSPEPCSNSQQKQTQKQLQFNSIGKGYEVPRNNLLKRVPSAAMTPRQNMSLPPLPPRRPSSSQEGENTKNVSKHKSLDSLVVPNASASLMTTNSSSKEKEHLIQIEEKKLLEPPVPPQRKKRIRSLHEEPHVSDTKSVSLDANVSDTKSSSLDSNASDTKSVSLDANVSDTKSSSLDSNASDTKSISMNANVSVGKSIKVGANVSDTKSSSLDSNASDTKSISMNANVSVGKSIKVGANVSDTKSVSFDGNASVEKSITEGANISDTKSISSDGNVSDTKSISVNANVSVEKSINVDTYVSDTKSVKMGANACNTKPVALTKPLKFDKKKLDKRPNIQTAEENVHSSPEVKKRGENNSPLLTSRLNSDTESDEKYSYSKIDLASKKPVCQKMPVPKPRGIRKPKPPEVPPKLDSITVKSNVSKDQLQGECFNEKGVEDRQYISGDETSSPKISRNETLSNPSQIVTKTGAIKETESHLVLDISSSSRSTQGVTKTGTESKSTVSNNKEQGNVKMSDSVKPKPPPKPKPRITTHTTV